MDVAGGVNVGVRPTFVTGRGVLVEAFLLDFDGDLYGRELRVEFLKRLRGEKRFESVDALVEQMGRDVEDARAMRLNRREGGQMPGLVEGKAGLVTGSAGGIGRATALALAREGAAGVLVTDLPRAGRTVWRLSV